MCTMPFGVTIREVCDTLLFIGRAGGLPIGL